MSILNKLSKLGAVTLLAASVMATPAIAQQTNFNGQSSVSVSHTDVKFNRSRRGNFRGHNRGNFRGSSRRNFRGNSRNSFRGNSRSSFRGNSFRGNSFRGNSFHRNSLRGNSFHRNSFRGSSFRGNSFRGNSFHRNSFRNDVHVGSSIYAVGGLYGVTSHTVFISDFGAHGLYSPPRGHHWVCDKGSKDAVLVAIATGAIVAIALDQLLQPY